MKDNRVELNRVGAVRVGFSAPLTAETTASVIAFIAKVNSEEKSKIMKENLKKCVNQ